MKYAVRFQPLKMHQVQGLSENENVLAILEQAEYSFSNPTIPEISAFWGAVPGMHEAVWESLLTPEEAAAKALEILIRRLLWEINNS